MLPVEKATGQLWIQNQYLCDVEYEVSAPFDVGTKSRVQRIKLDVPDEHCAQLLDAYNLSLKMQDGQSHHIPRPILHQRSSVLECYVEVS